MFARIPIFLGGKYTAENWCYPKQRKILLSYNLSRNPFDRVIEGKLIFVIAECSHLRKDPIMLFPIEIIRIGNGHQLMIQSFRNKNQSIGLRIWNFPQENGIQNAEDGAVSANPQTERKEDCKSEQPVLNE